MNKTKKTLLMTLGTLCLIVATVFGTLAYLTDTDAVTNTFTVGKVGLSLDEADVEPDGSYESDHNSRVKGNKYHLLPGHTYIKDPTVTVDAGSEDAYVRMIVTVKNVNNLKRALPNSGDTAKYYAADGTFLLQMLCVDENGICTWDANTWLFEGYTEKADEGYYEFRYKNVVAESEDDTVLKDLFEKITVPGEIDNVHLAYLDDVEIVVNAHAIQADGFADADAAWAAFTK